LCTFTGADLCRSLRSKTPKLQSLTLLLTRHPLTDFTTCLVGSLKELWMEDC